MGLQSRAPDAMGASPCVFVSDPSGRKALGIPKQAQDALITRTSAPLDTVEIRINSSQAAADAGIANGYRYAAAERTAGCRGCTTLHAAQRNKPA